MDSKKPLSEQEIATLYALYKAANESIHAHVPEHAVLARFRKDLRGFAREALADLTRRPETYVIKHPTKGGMTYQITLEGIKILKEKGII